MSRVLTFCWAEWRSQRALLLGYCALVFPSLMLAFGMVADTFWLQRGGVHALAWFVAAGAIGVVGFVTPQLVRGEFATGSDRFVRRLPGALAPSFHGKLLFLLLALLSLPLLGLLLGEVYLGAIGRSWSDLFDVRGADASVHLQWPEVAVYGGCALLLVPWVWALGTWLPQGRMALGGAILFVLCVGLVAWAAVRSCPNLAETLPWHGWLWWLPPLGLPVAAASWIRGRRGGGAPRSAVVGACVVALGFAPPAVWLGSCVHEYHRPDLQRSEQLTIDGISPDQRVVIGRAASQVGWIGVPVRIDLATGAAEQLADFATGCMPWVQRPYLAPRSLPVVQRIWHLYGRDGANHELLDLATGERVVTTTDAATGQLVVPPEWRARADEERQGGRYRLPGGRSAWLEEDRIVVQRADGTRSSTPWPAEHRDVSIVTAWGHAITGHDRDARVHFDLVAEQFVSLPKWASTEVLCVAGTWFWRAGSDWRRWYSSSAEGTPDRTPIPALQDSRILGLLGDDGLLCGRRRGCFEGLFVYEVATGSTVELELPAEAREVLQWAPPLRVDAAGRVWIGGLTKLLTTRWATGLFVAIDPATREVETMLRGDCDHDVLAFPSGAVVVLEGHRRIVRIDLASGARTVLFPRTAGDE